MVFGLPCALPDEDMYWPQPGRAEGNPFLMDAAERAAYEERMRQKWTPHEMRQAEVVLKNEYVCAA